MSSHLVDFFEQRKKAREATPQDKEKELQKTLAEQRQKIINFKKFFGEEHGRAVMLDLMNRFYVLNPLPDTVEEMALARAEGNREVVLYLLKRANTSIEQLDKMMKGEF